MSRCFPFPPPGYEKKARTDDTDLLKKEKHREKKQKKEKKDKEKREDKERREKERSDGKHRDKKDRKEKRRDKKKEKEKDRDKDKGESNTSEEKSNTAQSEIYNGDKLNQKERFSDKEKTSLSNEKTQGHYGEKPSQNSLLQWRIRDEEKGIGSQLVERPAVREQKHDVWMDKVVVKDTGILVEGKQNNVGKRVDYRKNDGQGRPLEKSMERSMDEKEKSKEVEGDRKQGNKRKDADREKKSHGKDKGRGKEKKKMKKSENKSEDKDKFKDRIKNDLLGVQNIRTSAKDGDRNTDTGGNLKKRKEFETNGFLHETDIRPSKMPRPSPHPSTENGRKLVPCRSPILSTSDCLGPPNNLKVDDKERKVNGVVEAHSLSLSSKKSSAIPKADQIAQAHSLSLSSKKSSAIAKAEQIAQASTKPPHPDSKYLDHIFSVPKMKDWSDFDDQEWLFSSRISRLSEKPDVGSTEAPRVWAEALQIESADVYALPYVIPY